MDKVLLSICMPTYKRKDIFSKAYYSITEQIRKNKAEDKIEYVISVNPSNDGTEQFLQQQNDEQFVRINVNNENIGADNNIALVLSMAVGKYVWMIGDDDVLLPDSIEKVLQLLEEHPDLAWIYMNYGYEDAEKKYLEPMYLIKNIQGYYADGRKAMLSNFKYLDGGILFTTANIYLRQGMDELKEKGVSGPQCTMVYTMYSASLGGAYIISEPMINQGQDILWREEAYDIVIKNFNNVLLKLIDNGFTRKEVMKLIRNRMTGEAVSIWFLLLKEFVVSPSKAINHYIWYLHLIPITTVLMTITLPFWAIYLLIRHKVRNKERNVQKVLLPRE